MYFSGLTTLDLALALDGAATGPHPYVVAGLASMDATAGQVVGFVSDGQVSLSDWSAVVGQKELVPGQRYYLSARNPGMLTSICPTAPGETVVSVGSAVSATQFEVEINLMVRL